MTSVRKKRKAFVEQSDCVACGCCVKVCPLGAIQIIKGVMAQVEKSPGIGLTTAHSSIPAQLSLLSAFTA